MTEGGADSLHRLVMDLHKALNRLAADCAEEILSGAHVFGLQCGRPHAGGKFHAGAQRDPPLKFNHPGLDTMATRSGGRLLIQNDIGTTDAHVVVIAVSEKRRDRDLYGRAPGAREILHRLVRQVCRRNGAGSTAMSRPDSARTMRSFSSPDSTRPTAPPTATPSSPRSAQRWCS